MHKTLPVWEGSYAVFCFAWRKELFYFDNPAERIGYAAVLDAGDIII